jgi:hypothetical protein
MHYPWKHHYPSSLLILPFPLPLVGTQRCSLCPPQRLGPEFHVYYVFGEKVDNGKLPPLYVVQQFKNLASCYIERLLLHLQAVNISGGIICWKQTCLDTSVHVTNSEIFCFFGFLWLYSNIFISATSQQQSSCRIWHAGHLLSHWFLACFTTLRHWIWRRHVLSKRRLALNGLYDVISQKIELF